MADFLLNIHYIFIIKFNLCIHRTYYEFSIDTEEELMVSRWNHSMSGINAGTSLRHQIRTVVIKFKVQVDLCTRYSGSNVKFAFIPSFAYPAVILALDFVK
jgi:hypothetical protein